MKKITSLLLATVFTMASFSQVKLTSSIIESYNGSQWENNSKSEYLYDVNNNLTEVNYFYWDTSNSLWQTSGKIIYVYNANDKVIEMIFQLLDFSTNQIENSFKGTYAYNSSGYIVEYKDYSWDGAAWIHDEDSDKSIITYSINKFDEIVSYSYDVASSSWVIDLESSQTTFVYNASDAIENEVLKDWDGAAWVNNSKDIYTYNSQGMITENIYQEWNGSVWENIDKLTYEFDSNKNIITENEYDYDNGWILDYQTVNTFDTTMLMSSFIHPFQEKTGVDYLYQNNPYKNKILSSVESWYNTTWNQSSRTTFYYGGATAGLDNFELNTISVYPNPTSDFVFIDEFANMATFKIFDVAGKTLLQDKINSNDKIDLRYLKKGMYILELKTIEGHIAYKKIYKK